MGEFRIITSSRPVSKLAEAAPASGIVSTNNSLVLTAKLIFLGKSRCLVCNVARQGKVYFFPLIFILIFKKIERGWHRFRWLIDSGVFFFGPILSEPSSYTVEKKIKRLEKGQNPNEKAQKFLLGQGHFCT